MSAVETAVDRIEQADLDLLQPAMKEWQAAGVILEQAQQVLQQAQTKFVATQGAVAYIRNRLAPKYDLTAKDGIDIDGVISREKRCKCEEDEHAGHLD